MTIDESDAGAQLVKAGLAIAGEVAGAGVGLLSAGPPGALVGAAAGAVLGQVAEEFGQRILGRRERARAGAVIIYAASAIMDGYKAGRRLRDDGFFEARDGRSSAEEIAEGVAMAARDAFEERKLPHIGYLYASAAFHSELDAHLCASVLRDARDLSWRQYVLLAAVHRGDRLPLPDIEIMLKDGRDWSGWGVRHELERLYWNGFIGAPSKKTGRTGLSLFNLALREQRLAHRGAILHSMLQLDEIPDEEILLLHKSLEVNADDNAGAGGDVDAGV